MSAPGTRSTPAATAALALLSALLFVVAPAAASAANPIKGTNGCGDLKVKPRTVVFACADAGLLASHLDWRHWGDRKAKGEGTIYAKTCDPDCTSGGVDRFPVVVVFRKLRTEHCSGKTVRAYTRYKLNFPGGKPANVGPFEAGDLFCSSGARRTSLSASGGDSVVLGSADFAPNGKGFGNAHPRRIFNGGDPSGLVRKIDWKHWGSPRATGKGRGYQFKPQGGYYGRTVAVELKASHIGRCPGHPRRAYTKLRARMQTKPGGHFGRWFTWAGASSICSFD